MIRVRQNYNSFKYWESLIHENKTIRGHMFMDNPPKEKSLYIHTLIFSKNNGIDNIYAYFPDAKVLLGYIQYSFLQEAFYIWINGRKQGISYIPLKPVEEIIKDGEKINRITKEESLEMKKQVERIKKLWSLPRNKILLELKKFVRDFNKAWYGDSTEFLYLKIFNTPEELGEFVINSSYMSSSVEEFEKMSSKSIDDWKIICSTADKDKITGEAFKKILLKYLTEVI